jgi:hypothetical protein
MMMNNASYLKKIEQSYGKAETLLREKESIHSVKTKDIHRLIQVIVDDKWVLVEQIVKEFNSFDIQSAKDTIVRLFPLIMKYEHLRNQLRSSPILKLKLRVIINELYMVTEELKELMSDLERYKASDLTELENLLYE